MSEQETASRHQFHLEVDDAFPGTTTHTIRLTCSCGHVVRRLRGVPEVFSAIKEHKGD